MTSQLNQLSDEELISEYLNNESELKDLTFSNFVHYGVTDTMLIKRIDEKKNFTALMLMISEKMGVQLGDSMGTVKPWAQFIANKSIQDMKVLPPKQEHDQPDVVGGYVREPNTGKHKWVLSSDVNSMYPLLGMVGFNMSPETNIPKYKLPADLRDLVLQNFNNQDEGSKLELSEAVWAKTTELLKENNMCLGVNGAVFSTDKVGMVPELVLDIYNTRKVAKKTQFAYDRQAILIKQILKERKND